MPVAAAEFLKEQNEFYNQKLTSVKGILRLLGWSRLISFLLIIVPFIIFGLYNSIAVGLALFFVVLFLFLVKKNQQFEKKKEKYSIIIKLSTDELLALEDQFNHFENGAEFLNPEHYNSYDLDLFGDGSVFQYLNRTSTHVGRQLLANWLKDPSLDNIEIEKRQLAVRELTEDQEWMLQFRTLGHVFNETKEQSNEIRSWAGTILTLPKPKVIGWLLLIVPLITIIAGIYAISGGSSLWVVIMILIQLGFLFLMRKKISFYFSFFGRKTDLLEKYINLIKFIETKEFNSGYLKDLKKLVLNPDSASRIFDRLKKHVIRFEYRQNIIIGFFFNAVLMWDIRCMYYLWKWHRRYYKKLVGWLEVISQIDALISLANMANNNPAFRFPTIHEGGFTFNAKQLGHPLIPTGKRVNNDLLIHGWGKVLIVTGANMAGKSTFLRTVGVNMVLGSIGAPVCAEQMIFRPVKIYTNMRTTDSLLKDESYFFAEIRRIKEVLDRLKQGERIFVILDEMLKGTNSVDKLNGSKALIKKLLELKAVAIIATHDLKISTLEEEYPQLVYNKCFEIKLVGDDMIFDYKLRNGATTTMNATYLMRKMGIL